MSRGRRQIRLPDDNYSLYSFDFYIHKASSKQLLMAREPPALGSIELLDTTDIRKASAGATGRPNLKISTSAVQPLYVYPLFA